MSTPVILVCGPAGSGKDTVASIIAKNHNGVCIALADPMKRFAAQVFGFTEMQLWGPSECRNAIDERYTDPEAWEEAYRRLSLCAWVWIDSLDLPETGPATKELLSWFEGLKYSCCAGEAPKPVTARLVLQTLGTEWGRHVSRDIWINYGLKTATTLLAGGPQYNRTIGLTEDVGYHAPEFVLITDGRFRNELVKVKMSGGTTVLVRPRGRSGDAAATAAAGVHGHQSESELAGIPRHFYDYQVFNNKMHGIAALEEVAGNLMRDIVGPTNYFCTMPEAA